MLCVLFFLRFRMSVLEKDTVHRVCVEEVNMFVILSTKIGNVINHQEHIKTSRYKSFIANGRLKKIMSEKSASLKNSFLEISPDGMTTLPEEAICSSS